MPLQADLEMHIIKNGYVGLTRLPNSEVDVCGLFRRSSERKDTGIRGAVGTPRPTSCAQVGRGVPTAPLTPLNIPRSWQEVFKNGPPTELSNRLANASYDESSSCSVGGLFLRRQRAAELPELCIGDSLTMTPPVTGNGMSMAFESAELAIGPLVAYSQGELDWPQAQQTIAHSCDRAFSGRLAWARVLQWMMFAPAFKGSLATLVLRSNWLWQTMFTNTR